jgi:hypothetical protein
VTVAQLLILMMPACTAQQHIGCDTIFAHWVAQHLLISATDVPCLCRAWVLAAVPSPTGSLHCPRALHCQVGRVSKTASSPSSSSASGAAWSFGSRCVWGSSIVRQACLSAKASAPPRQLIGRALDQGAMSPLPPGALFAAAGHVLGRNAVQHRPGCCLAALPLLRICGGAAATAAGGAAHRHRGTGRHGRRIYLAPLAVNAAGSAVPRG